MRLLQATLLVDSLFLFITLAHSNPNPWCDKKYECFNQMKGRQCKHTMCVHPEKGSSSCNQWQHGLTDDEKAFILHFHNEVRAQVARGEIQGQPKATNMLRMEWDNEVEMIAQRWASQCDDKEGHDDCRQLWSGEDGGQNYAWKRGGSSYQSTPSRIQILETMFKNQWIFNEVVKVRPQYVAAFPSNALGIGHYTQAVWAESTRLGCGLAYLEKNNRGMLIWEYRLICNYVRRGNMVGDPIYLRGNYPATKCPKDSVPSFTYQGLCEYRKEYHELLDRPDKKSKPTNPVQQSDHSSSRRPVQTQPSPPDAKNTKHPGTTPPHKKHTSKTDNKPADGKPQSSSKFSFNWGNLPLVGRFLNKNQEQPSTEKKPLEFGLVKRTQSRNEQKTDIPNHDTKTNNAEKPKYGIRKPITDPTQRVDTPKVTPRPTLDDEFEERPAVPLSVSTPTYAGNPSENESPGRFNVEVRHVPRSDPFAEIRRQHEDFHRRVQASHDEFNRRFEETTGISSSIFDPPREFYAPPSGISASPYSQSRIFGTTSRFDGGFESPDG